MSDADTDKATRATQRACAQELSKIARKLFDSPEQAITLMRRIIERHGVHPSEIAISVNGVDEVKELRQEVNELMAAQVRQYDTFETACASKGYVGEKALAQAVNVEPGQIRNWKEIGRVPAIFFYKLSMAPDRAAAKQQASQEKIRLREATRLAKQQLQQAAKQAARQGKKPRRPLSGAERHEQAMARDPDLYARAQARFAELVAQSGKKRVKATEILDQVNQELGAKLPRTAAAWFAGHPRAELYGPPPPPVAKLQILPSIELFLQAAE